VILLLISYAVALAPAIALLVSLRRWVHSPAGQRSIREWPAAIVIPLQTAIALLWLQALFAFPWLVWDLQQIIGNPWWEFLRSAQGIFLAVFLPVSVSLVGDSWLRLHPLPESWMLTRILLIGLGGVASAVVIAETASNIDGGAGGLMFFFSLLTTLFLARWWLISHPVSRGTNSTS
jgi:hypothetical protein